MHRTLLATVAAVLAPVVSAGDFIIGTVPYERDTLGRVELPQRVAWKVLPAYRGVRDDGVFTDNRITLVLEDRERSFWPIVARLDDDEARQLTNTLAQFIRDKALAGPNADHEARGMTTSLYTKAYTLNEHKAFELGGDGVAFRVLASYRGVDERGERVTDERITLVLQDAEKSFWPAISWLDLASARTLHAELERVLATRVSEDDC